MFSQPFDQVSSIQLQYLYTLKHVFKTLWHTNQYGPLGKHRSLVLLKINNAWYGMLWGRGKFWINSDTVRSKANLFCPSFHANDV